MGHAPQSAANDASVAATFRVVAGRNDEFGRDVGTDAELGEQRRCGEMDELAEVAVEVVDLLSQRQPALGESSHRATGGRDRVGAVAGTPACCPPGALFGVETSQLVADLVGRGVEHRRDLVGGLGASLDRGATHELGDSDRFDDAVAGLGCCGGFAGEHGAGGRMGVCWVGLSVASPVLAVRSMQLDDLHIVGSEERCEIGAAGSGSFDSGSFERSERSRPGAELAVSTTCGGNLELAEMAPELVDCECDVEVGVGVDADDDLRCGSDIVVRLLL